MRSIVDDYKELYDELYERGIENLSRAEVIELLKIDAVYCLSKAIRDCFESNSRLPSIPEAIVMASDSIERGLSKLKEDK